MVHLIGQYVEKRKEAKDSCAFFRGGTDKAIVKNYSSDHLAPLRARIRNIIYQNELDEGKVISLNGDLKDAYAEKRLKEKEIRDAEKLERSIKKRIDSMQGNDVEDAKNKFWAIYRAPVVASPKKYTEIQIEEMKSYGESIVRLDSTLMTSDVALGTAYKEITELHPEVIRLKGIVSKWYGSKDRAERLKSSKVAMETAVADFEALEAIIKMDEA
jgi:hypothetical protein